MSEFYIAYSVSAGERVVGFVNRGTLSSAAAKDELERGRIHWRGTMAKAII